MVSTDFTAASRTITVSKFATRRLNPDIVVVSGDPTEPASTQTTFTSLSGAPLKIASAAAGDGNGVYDLTTSFERAVPAETYTGAYSATLTVDVAVGATMKASALAMQPPKRILVTLLGLGLAVAGVGGAVQAQELTPTDSQLRFGITPAHANEDDSTSFNYFTHHLESGDEAPVINESDLPVRLQVYVAEATTAINGGTAFGHRNENSDDVAD